MPRPKSALNDIPDVLVVGSGPAGVSAALPLAEAGKRVLVLAGLPNTPEGSPLDRAALQAPSNLSPKWRQPHVIAEVERYRRFYELGASEFLIAGSLGEGGLSRVWGAGVARFSASECADWPIDFETLATSYAAVERRIGISGEPDDMAAFFGPTAELQPSPPLGPAASALARAVPRFASPRFSLGRGRNAVRTSPADAGDSCTLLGRCLLGCPRGAIYSAERDLAALYSEQYPAVRVVRGLARELVIGGAQPAVLAECGGENRVLRARAVILACGAIGTATLVLRALAPHGGTLPILSHPTAGYGVWVPKALGSAVPQEMFGLSQLAWVARETSDGAAFAFGNLFAAAALPPHEVIERLPLSLAASRLLARGLVPSLLLGNVYLRSPQQPHNLQFNTNELRLQPGPAPAPQEWKRAFRALTAGLAQRGGALLPGSSHVAPPGGDAHYAGATPMRSAPGPLECAPDGQLAGARGFYVADGAALPSLPLKPPTLTIMANAHRIGRQLADR